MGTKNPLFSILIYLPFNCTLFAAILQLLFQIFRNFFIFCCFGRIFDWFFFQEMLYYYCLLKKRVFLRLKISVVLKINYGKIISKIGGVNMSRVCNICGKGQASGNNVSHSNRKTRRTFKVNVQKISYVEDGKETNGYVCARCIRTLKKAD